MSAALYPTRLWWENGRGIARHDGVEVVLKVNPSPTYSEIDYAPGCVAMVREGFDARRDMSHDESLAMWRFLERMAHAARSMVSP